MTCRSHACAGTRALLSAFVALALGLLATPARGQSSSSDEDRATASATPDSSTPMDEAADAPAGDGDAAAMEEPRSDDSPQPDKASANSRTRVAVLEIRGSGLHTYGGRPTVDLGNTVRLAPPPNFTDGLTEILTTALIEQRRYQVLERAKINEVLAEQDLASAGRVNKRTAAETGNITGAQILITGDVTEFSYQQSAVGGALGLFKKKTRIGAGVGKITAKMALDLRMIDATTGEVLGSSRGEGKASTTGVAADFAQSDKALGAGTAQQTPLGKAARQAVEEALEELAKSTESSN
jgi:curli biogenesis system outer membrane secretion channel CsgG